MPIDPLFGIELTAAQLTNNIPMAPLYVVTPNNKFVPVKSDVTGRLEITGSIGGAPSGGTETLARIAFGSVPVAYVIGAQLVTTAIRNHLLVRNDTDGDILLSLDGATDNFKILANEVGSFDGVTIASGATVRVKQDGGAPSLGEVTISAWSDV